MSAFPYRRRRNGLASAAAVLVALLVFALLPWAAAAPGDLDPGFNPNFNSYPYVVTLLPDGRTIAGGTFTTVGGTARSYLARLNVDGTLDASFTPSVAGSVSCVVVQADGKVIIGGAFTSVNGTTRNYAARLNADGSLDTGFDPNLNGEVYCAALQADGKVLVGGNFSTVGGAARYGLARLTANGTMDFSFAPNSSLTSSVLIQPDGKVVATWAINTASVSRFNPNGTTDFTVTLNLPAYAIALQADGKIVCGGSFTSVGGVPRNHLARLNADGTLDTGFDPNASNQVYNVTVQTDGKLLVAGAFTTMGGVTRSGTARLMDSGALDTTFVANVTDISDFPRYGYSIAPQADGRLLLGGYFTKVNGTGRNWCARLVNDATSGSFAASNSSRVAWLRGGASPETSQVTFELSTDGGSNWTSLGTGTRIAGGWEKTGLSLPASGGIIRGRARTIAGYRSGSSGLVEAVATLLDTVTLAPTLTAPGNATVNKAPVSVTINLPEAALTGSVMLTFAGTAARTLVLASSQQTAGVHIFSFDPADPTATTDIASISGGTTIPDGLYSVTLSYQDAGGNPAATATTTNVTLDTVTQAPTLSAPASGLTTKSPVSVSFNLPEAGLAGSVTLTFDDGTTQRALVLASAQASAGAHSFTFNPASPTTSSGGAITSGPAIPAGIYSVTLSYKDAVGNAVATAAAANVTLDLTTQAPTLTTPVAGTVTRSPVSVGFSLPEAGLAGSVKLAFSGTASRTLTLASSFETSGSKSFSFNPASPLGSAVVSISGGSTIPDGLYTVTLSYQDALGNVSASASASSVRIDTTAPTFSLPGNLTIEATSAFGAVVNYSASASDSGSGLASAAFTPASGSAFPIGTTTVNATATDNVGNTATGSFSITVRDTTHPVVAAHANVTAEAAGPGGAIVTFAPASASDAVGVTSIAYNQSSGTSFPIGTTTVLIFALDAAGNLGTGTFTVTVQDMTAPVVSPPANVTVEATSAAGAVATYANATATDAVGVTSLVYSQASGTTFPIGTTIVMATANDAANNAGVASFTVTVQDTTPPVVTPPANVTVHATSPAGAVVTFTPTASDAVGVTSLGSAPASGSAFPNGTTTVTVTAKDAANNTGTATFTVTVTPLTTLENWRYAAFGSAANSGEAANVADWDHDGVANGLEFAFGSDPASSASGGAALRYAGTFAGGGTIAARGGPRVMSEETGGATEFRALFVRRVDYAAAGLTYTVEFSANLASWEASTATPAVLADDGAYQIVSVPYAALVGGERALFFRVWVDVAP